MAGTASQMLPANRINPDRQRSRVHTQQTNEAFADAFAANFPQGPAAKRDGLVRILVEQGLPFEEAGAQADEMLRGATMLPGAAPVPPHLLGRGGDTTMLHVRPDEIPAIQDALDFKGTTNPRTGYLEFGGGGGTINGKGGSGNVSGGGRGNAGGGGFGNTGKGEQSRVNDRPGQQQQSWGNRPETSYGAPGNMGKYGTVALPEDKWSALKDQVDAYNDAAHKWNSGANRSLANFFNNAEPFGFSMQAPQLARPNTYVGGDYHLGLNPAALAGSVLGGASMIPGAGTALGGVLGKAYELSGAHNVMLGGDAVPGSWRDDLSTGKGTPQDGVGSGGDPTGRGRGDAGGTKLLPPISGNPNPTVTAPRTSPTPLPAGSSLPPITVPGGWQHVAGPNAIMAGAGRRGQSGLSPRSYRPCPGNRGAGLLCRVSRARAL
jgi:hypothetical protein